MVAGKAVEKADYGNWVSRRLIWVPGAIGCVFLALTPLSLLFLIGAAVFLLPCGYFAYAYHSFSRRGGDVQGKMVELLMQHVDWDGYGRALDIGCGNGLVTVALAQRHLQAEVSGIDYWGAGWDYSQRACRRNAENEQVADRLSFQRASAAALPFRDGQFDLAVSNLVFHEVGDARDKREVLREALRVVREGGAFAFQDLFLLRHAYGEIDDLLETVRSWGVSSVAFVDTSRSSFIPGALRLPFMLGSVGIIHGTK